MAKVPKAHVVIVGGGFGGLYAAKMLANKEVEVTLVDHRNYHLFQPLLYQVATGGLSPGDIASPLRAVLKKAKNIRVLMATAKDINPNSQCLITDRESIPYDYLILAPGSWKNYFDHPEWETWAPSLKTVEDALRVRKKVLTAFEMAEWEDNEKERSSWLTFAIVGGGPTGVELAGALAELARATLRSDFRNFNPKTQTQIILIEAGPRILPSFPQKLSERAFFALRKLGVEIKVNSLVTDISPQSVTLRTSHGEEQISTKTVLWAAGIAPSPWASILKRRLSASLHPSGRVIVAGDLSLPSASNVFVIGDLAYCLDTKGRPMPALAPVAMQQGRHAARMIIARLHNRPPKFFTYRDKGELAVIGRNAAVAKFGHLHFSGFLAWVIWAFVHIWYLIEFDNKVLVFFQWAWNYFTRNRGARLIGKDDV